MVEYNYKAIISDPGLFFIRSFVITDSVSLAVTGLFIFSISFWFSLERLYISRNVQCFYIFYLIGIWLSIIISYHLLYFCGVGCNLSSLIFKTYLGLLSFFLISLAKCLSVFFIFSKNQELVFCKNLFLIFPLRYLLFFLSDDFGFCLHLFF